MRVVHVTTTDYGGAYRAAQNISKALKMNGVDSEVLVREKHSEESVVPYFGNGFRLLISKTKNLINLALSSKQGKIVNDVFGTDITDHPLVTGADVIVLHWVNSFISYSSVKRLIALRKPVYWVMHDMWPFTGGCHYDEECNGYSEWCRTGMCCGIPQAKRNAVCDSGIVFVGPSRWITDCAAGSSLLRNMRCVNINNPVDTSLFKPEGRFENHEKKRIVFSAMIPGDDRKGLDLLKESFSMLPPDGYEAFVIGGTGKTDTDGFAINTTRLGCLKTPAEIRRAYSGMDVSVVPSRQENLSNTVLESMACGIPVVAFDVGGMGDMIEHKVNGYLARPFDTSDFAKGIEYCACHADKLGRAARTTAVERFSMDIIGKKYVDLFREQSVY